jgi:hypothetical protein
MLEFAMSIAGVIIAKKSFKAVVGSNPLNQAASFKARIQDATVPFPGAKRNAESGLSTMPSKTTRRNGT